MAEVNVGAGYAIGMVAQRGNCEVFQGPLSPHSVSTSGQHARTHLRPLWQFSKQDRAACATGECDDTDARTVRRWSGSRRS